MGIIGLLLALALPAVQSSREAARDAQCRNNLRQFGIALTNCESASGVFPASVTATVQGLRSPDQKLRIHNYMLELLPFFEVSRAPNPALDFVEGENAALIAQPLGFVLCPSAPPREATTPATLSAAGLASALGVIPVNPTLAQLIAQLGDVGERDFEAAPGDYSVPACVSRQVADALGYPTAATGVAAKLPMPAMFPLPVEELLRITPAELAAARGKLEWSVRRKASTIVDGLSTTLAVIEVAGRPESWTRYDRLMSKEPAYGAGWADPSSVIIIDAVQRPLKGLVCGANSGKPYSFHPAGINVTFADGHVMRIAEAIDPRAFVAQITPDGGEVETAGQ